MKDRVGFSVLSQAAEPSGVLSELEGEEMKFYGGVYHFLGLERQVEPLSYIKSSHSFFLLPFPSFA